MLKEVRTIGLLSTFRKAKDNVKKKIYNGYYSQQILIPPNLSTADYLRSYGEIGWLFACVSKIAQNVAEPDWSAYKNDKEVTNSQALTVLNHPNPYMSQFELMELTDMYLSLAGKCFWYIAKDKAGRNKEIWPISPLDMWVLPDADNFVKGYMYRAGAQNIPFEADEIIFFKLPNPYNPYDGVGPAQGARYSLENDKYSLEANRNFFFNGCQLSGIMNIEQNMDDETFDRFKAEFEDRYRGVDNAHRIAFIEGAKATFTSLTMSQKDMDFYNLRQMSRDEILGTFGVHKSILGLTDDVSRANAETAEYVFQKHTVKPRLERIRDKLNHEYVQMFGEDIMLGYTDPIPENKEFIVDTVNSLSNKVITVNEGRKILNKLLDDVNLDPLPDGDVIWQNMGLVPMGAPAQETVAQPTNEPVNEKPVEEPGEDTGDKSFKKKDKLFNKEFYKTLDKESYWKAFVNKTDGFEKEIKPVWKNIFEKQKNKINTNIRKQKSHRIKELNIEDILNFLSGKEESDFMKEQIITVLKKIIQDKGDQVMNELDVDTSFNLHDPKVTQWLENYCGDQIKNINSTTKDLIRKQIVDGQNNGESIPKLVDRLSEYFDNMKDYRVERIARTEVIGASNNASLMGYKQSGVVDKKQWLTAIDERTRPWHAEADGQTVGLNDKFNVDGEDLDCPGDSTGSPENVVNCRCTLIPSFD